MVYRPYFKSQSGPPPLSVVCERVVRLEEVDALGIVWHGRYAGYFEDGREEIGREYGLSYVEFKEADTLLPIRTLHMDYLAPLRYLEKFTIETTLHWHEAARLNMEYKIYNSNGDLTTKAYSVQMMVDFSGMFMLEAPPFYLAFQKRWRQGEFNQCEF